jgi:glucan phosphoethanolaminetransferase (alkaline phosphatase superfamily)
MRKILKKKNTETRFTNAFKDMMAIIAISLFAVALAYFFNVFAFIVVLFQKHPKAITYIDEIIVFLLSLSIGFAIFSWRRWIELKKETSERIKLQEELIRIAHTKADTERIISRQLHHEIELRKQLEKDLDENSSHRG